LAGVLLQIQEFFNISNASAGLLQTVFIISYMVVAPVFGYLGDRYNRKIVMLVGMIIWSGCTLFASFVNNPSHFVLFLGMRGLVGIGEASYSTIAPTIIADLFVKEKRTNMLSVFYFAIPVGSGLGYIVGSAAAKGFGSWHWALRITPGLGLVTMVLMLLVIPNTKRGASEAESDLVEKKETETKTSYKEDLIYIFKNKSFMSVTIGFTFMAFVVGSLTIWGPIFVAYSQVISGELQPCTDDACEYGNVSFVFGLITCVAGFMGVFIGAESAKRWKARGQKNADALVCAIGLISAAPLLLAGFQLATVNVTAAWTFIFLADLAQCLTWTLVGDMTLYVTMPSRRSTANSVQILTMHLLGDAGSPYLLGVMSDHITASMPATYYSKYIGLLHSMYVALFASVLGGCGFLIASLFIVRDKKK
uniref:Major facilitator superfamily (MFS) profile domain-containing protein n=1 Tax=Ciona savignyi TaxID=51511 RepID=H2ZMR3_CIOSA